jgi:hypothetical protein
LDDKDRNISTLWNQVYVPSMRGPMALNQFADVSETSRPRGIDRERRSRKMVIWGTLDRTQTFGVVLANVQKLVDSLPQPYSGEIQGDKEVFEEMVGSFTLAIVGSLFFIFVILAAQFENLLRPFVILLTLPLAVIGGFVGLYIAGQQLALGALIGMVFLIGLAAKNGILLVDAIGVKEKQMPLLQAVQESVRERSRAILMTSIAMIFGMIPTAVMRGGGSEFRSPMAIAIIGGVISSTVLSFFVVPAVFGLLDRFRSGRSRQDQQLRSSNAVHTSVIFLFGIFAFGFSSPAGAAATKMQSAVTSDVGRGALAFRSAEMSKVIALISKLRADSPEMAQIEGAERAAVEATHTAVESIFGGARLEYGKEWYRPGVTQSFNLPLPPPVGPVSSQTVVIPRQQSTFSFGWQIPLMNAQVVYGWVMRGALHAQADKIREARFESGTLGAAQLLLQTEMSVQTSLVNQGFVEISQAREEIVRQRFVAGLATRLELNQAEAASLAAVAQREQAKAEETRLRQQFLQQVGIAYPSDGLGLTQFPFVTGKPFQSSALDALHSVYQVQLKNSALSDASFFPQVNFELGYSKKSYETAPEPQRFAAIKARWDFLDGGARSAVRGRNMQAALDVLAQFRQLENQLRSSYDTLQTRFEALQRAQTAAAFAQRAAAAAQQQALQSYAAGLARALDVRSADEAKLRADFAHLQLQFALQGLSLESLALTSSWNSYLRASL